MATKSIDDRKNSSNNEFNNKNRIIPVAPYPPLTTTTTAMTDLRKSPLSIHTTSMSSHNTNSNSNMSMSASSSSSYMNKTMNRNRTNNMKSTISTTSATTPSKSRNSDSSSDYTNNTSKNTAYKHGQMHYGNYPTKIEFCPSHRNIYGIINYHHHQPNPSTTNIKIDENANSESDKTISYSKDTKPLSSKNWRGTRIASRLGPVLLELAYFQPRHHMNSNNSYSDDNTDIHVLATSRGNPALGMNIASTCLSFRGSLDTSNAYYDDTVFHCATGTSSGALCIHSFKGNSNSGNNGATASVQYYVPPRYHRMATDVAWRNRTIGSQNVAIGLVGANNSNNSSSNNNYYYQHHDIRSSSSDRDFCCLVWDVETQGTALDTNNNDPLNSNSNSSNMTMLGGVPVSVKTPSYRLAHNAPVASLSWLCDAQFLAIGCQSRGNMQIYDLRISGTNVPPIAVHAHEHSAVQKIVGDPFRPTMFASYSKNVVKLWDIRRMNNDSSSSGSVYTIKCPSPVSDMAWSLSSSGTLCIVTNSYLRYYDTESSRPILTNLAQTNSKNPIQKLYFQPPNNPLASTTTKSTNDNDSGSWWNLEPKTSNSSSTLELYPHRLLTVQSDGTIKDMSQHQIAPIAISPRDGRVSHSLGNIVWMGKTTDGPTGMEHTEYKMDEDISTTMMRRARCLHHARYSTDISLNLQMLFGERQIDYRNEEIQMESSASANFNHHAEYIHNNTNKSKDRETDEPTSLSARRQLFRLWEWIQRVENLCSSEGSGSSSLIDDLPTWPVKGLIDAGVIKLLRIEIDESDDLHLYDKVSPSDTLFCNTYDSPMRRAALTACGWKGRFGLRDVLADCEETGHFERSAALAVWSGDLGEAVAALQRGADHIRSIAQEGKNINCNRPQRLSSVQYAETLELVAMCLAGYTPNGSNTSGVWRRACEGLLQRQDLSPKLSVTTYIHYLRATCTFLSSIGLINGYERILDDEVLSLSDRVAFACRFLPRRDLILYLNHSMKKCMKSGNLEGLVITGLGKLGISILQSYVDAFSDVQTAALVSSRVALPMDWVEERIICSEWLDCYRAILNTWQMWQSRATFDVGRADLLRKLRNKQAEDMAANAIPPGGRTHPSRRSAYGQSSAIIHKKSYHPFSGSKQQDAEAPIPIFPPQLYARCNFCNTSLPLSKLRRQEGIANSWLSRQKPVLSCCPKCRKPLPRCAICLLPMGGLNPYMELQRESNRSSRGHNNLQNGENFSDLSSLPFAEWWTWCMRCKHGGHAHHLVGWFANHETCPVSGCDCKCQFDGIQKLARPALCEVASKNES